MYECFFSRSHQVLMEAIRERKIVARKKEFISHLFNKLVIIKINESDKNVDGDANAGLCEHNDPRRCCLRGLSSEYK